MPSASAGEVPVPATTAAAEVRREPAYQVRDVLYPTDLAPESERAFEHARFLAESFQARLTLYHAVEFPDPVYVHWGFNRSHAVWLEIEQSARQQLLHKAEALPGSHAVEVERVASAQRALLALIRKQQPDLVVMATHGRGGLGHMLMGSVTEFVFQHAFRPVLCVREPEHGGALPYRKILVPTDLSLGSRLAFPIAARFARQFGSEVLALHVAGSGAAGSPREVPSESWLWRFCQSDFPGVEVSAQLQNGVVWHNIVETAKLEKADLIVMSTRGHDSLSDRVMGSNTERVVRHAPCPVLVA
jgi:nucleotide-binding universal stress UspA family protein